MHSCITDALLVMQRIIASAGSHDIIQSSLYHPNAPLSLLISICLDIRADVIFVHAQNSGEQVGPLAELDAWTERAKRLNSIDAQLTGPGITQVGQVLKAADSAYYPAFNRCGPQSQLRGAVLHLL